MNPSYTVFVYGTLKRGQCRASALDGQQFLGIACTRPSYRMYDCGSYPGLVEHNNGRAIEGEVWSIDADCLARLDIIEAVDSGLYQRGIVQLQAPFSDRDVLTYFFCHDVRGLEDSGTVWK